MKINDSLLRKLLSSWPIARLATVSAAGLPHVVPIVFVMDGEHIYSPIDGKLKRGTKLKRLRNIQENSSVSLLLDEYTDNWQQLWWVRIDGSAEIYPPDITRAQSLEKRLMEKYPQYEDRRLLASDSPYLRITWHLGASWAQSGDPARTIEQAIHASDKHPE